MWSRVVQNVKPDQPGKYVLSLVRNMTRWQDGHSGNETNTIGSGRTHISFARLTEIHRIYAHFWCTLATKTLNALFASSKP
jgi:hypothetical protein